jgi:heme A synthase
MFRQSSDRRNLLKSLSGSVEKISHDLRGTLPSGCNRLLESVAFLIACVIFISIVSLKFSSLLFCLFLSGLMVIFIQKFGQQVHFKKRWIILLQILVVVVIFSGLWLDYFAAPAQAQFFKKAEDFFQNTLTQGSTTTDNTRTAISLVFNVLRAIYLLYIAGSLVSVINAVRKDEDWQSIARTPLLVVIAVTIADVLTGFIIGEPNK